MASFCVGLLPEHRALVARHVHHQFTLAPLRFAPLRDYGHQPQQLAAGPPHPRRRLAQQPSSLHGFGAPGFFWWEIDVTYYTLKVMSWLGIVWDLRKV